LSSSTFFIVLACLPGIRQSLSATSAQLQLVVASYAIANGCFLIVGGKLGDIFGRKRAFGCGVVVFAVASVGCGLASTITALIALRALQGLGGALLQPQVLGLMALNSDEGGRQRVFGIYAASMGSSGIAAQLIGGTLVDAFPGGAGWRACFILSLPVSALAIVMARSSKDGPRSTGAKIDYVGAMLLTAGLAALTSVLTLGREQGWPGWSRVAALVGVCCVAGLFQWQRMGDGESPRILPQSLFGTNEFTRAVLAVLVFFMGVASFYFVLSLQLQSLHAFTATEVGLVFAWMGTFFVLVSSSQRIKAWLGRRWAHVGIVTLSAGHLLMLISALGSDLTAKVIPLLAGCCLQGVGLGALMGQLMANAVTRLRQEEASVGSGVAATSQQVGNALGVCLIGMGYFQAGSTNTTAMTSVTAYLIAVLGILWVLLRGDTPGKTP
jgi:MFS family permease